MSKVTIKEIDSTIENQITTAMIISTKFLSEVSSLFDKDYLKNSFAKIICFWCLDYYKQYKKAPGIHIKDIFKIESELGMTSEDKEIIGTFLSKLNKQYVEDQGINSDYIRDNAFNYFKQRELEIRVDKASKLLKVGKVEEAEEQFTKFKKIAYQVSGWFNPFEASEVMEVFDDTDSGIFLLPGALGQVMGPIERDWFIAVLAPFKKGKCIAKGSMILLPNGSLKPIEKIIEDKDKYILSKDNSGKIVKGEITDYYVNGLKETYLVKTRLGREVSVTHNHPFFTPNGWVALDKISIGDFIACPKRYPNLGTKTYESYKLKLLAYMIAEGCFRGNGSHTFTNKCKKIQDDFKSCAEQMGDLTTKVNEITTRIISKKGKGSPGGSNLKKWITKLGMNQKLSKEKTIPDFVFKLQNKDIALFLSILFTCDGSVYKEGENTIVISYGSASKKLIEQINHLLLRFNIIGRIKPIIYKGFSSWEIILADMISINKFMSQIGFIYEKQIKAKKLLSEIIEKRCQKSNVDAIPYEVLKTIIPDERPIKNEAIRQCYKKKGKICRSRLPQLMHSYPQIKSIIDDDLLWDSIAEIIPLGKQETFDLTVKDYHNFIADDVFVHNTWFLQEMAVRAIFQRLKVVFISLEMKKKNIKERLYKRVTGFGSRSGEDVFLYPVFDCELNQTGECERPERANQITLRTANGEKPDFDLDMEYRPCSYCRTNMIMDYRLETWYETIEIPQFSFSSTRKQLSALSRMYGDNLRVISYPRFTASISDIRRDLYILEQHDEFIPDVIIVDYADILKPDSTKGKKLDDIDDIWKMLASMAAEKHCIVFTASQGTRSSIYKSDMSQDDLAEWIGKLGHVDMFLGLNQTKDEKRSKIIRVNGLVHRHKEIDENVFACLLQQLEVGQFCMDSHLMRR